MVVEYKFSIGDKVYIEEIKRKGYITGMGFYRTGAQYLVRFFDKANVQSEWFFEEELALQSKKSLGFDLEQEPKDYCHS